MKFVPTGDGYFIDPKTGKKISVNEMMRYLKAKGDNNANKDEGAGAEIASSDKKADFGQTEDRV